jgi:hypothetical protein
VQVTSLAHCLRLGREPVAVSVDARQCLVELSFTISRSVQVQLVTKTASPALQ